MFASLFKSMSNRMKQNFFKELVTSDSKVSSKSFFLVVTTIVGVLLLLVPVIALLTEVYFNHTIATDMNGMAAYIGAVAAMFASVGITKAWSEYSENKYGRYGGKKTEDTEKAES